MESSPANASQRRFFLLDQIEPGCARTLVKRIDIAGPIDHSRLRTAILALLEEQTALRMSMTPVNGELRVDVHPAASVPVAEAAFDITGAEDNQDWLEDLSRPFEHDNGPLCRVLIRHWLDKSTVAWAVHHAIFDDFSTPILLSRLTDLYRGANPQLRPHSPLSLSPLGSLETRQSFWCEKLREIPRATALPAPRFRAVGRTRVTMNRALSPVLGHEMRDALLKKGWTFFTLLAAASGLVFSWYLRQRDIIVMTSCQPSTRLGTTDIGCYQNTLPICMHVRSHDFSEFVEYVQECILESYASGDLSIEDIIEQAPRLRAEEPHKPLSDIFVGVSDEPLCERAGDTCWELRDIAPRDTEYPLSLMLVTVDGRPAHLRADWAMGQLDNPTMEALLKHLEVALQRLLSGAEGDVGSALLLDSEERVELHRLCRSQLPSYSSTGLVNTIVDVARRDSAAIAVATGGLTLSFGEIMTRSRAVAAALRARNIGPGDRVAIALPRNQGLVPAVLGTMWAGAAFVPIDATYPEKRIGQILQDARPALLLAETFQHQALPTLDPARIKQVENTCDLSDDPSLPAYIMYTSGSTGQPKGVVVDRHSVSHLLQAVERRLGTKAQTIIAGTSLVFDISILELFWPLTSGRRLHLTDHRTMLAGSLPKDAIYQCTPTIARTLVATRPGLDFLSTLRILLVGGERLTPDLAQKLRSAMSGALWNCYGPTEATIWSILGEVTDHVRPVLGWPLAGESCYVVDDQGRPLPPGWPGNLIIGGVGLARQYWGRPDLTQEKFRSFVDVDLQRGYDTGDVGILHRDAGFDFLERADSQTKIAGQRVELEEIEARIREIDGVRDAAVSVIEATLVALVCLSGPHTASEPHPLTVSDEGRIRAHLALHLPAAMVPARFIGLQSLPQLPSGKLDRRALSVLAQTATRAAPVVQVRSDSSEALVTAVWSRVLGQDIASQSDAHIQSFFNLGGTSAGLLRAFDELSQYFPHLRLADLFTHTTAQSLANFLKRKPTGDMDREPREKRGRYEATARFASRRKIKGRGSDG